MATRLDAVLLDRDGTINVKAAEGDYITCPDQLELLPGAAEGIRALNRADVPVVVVTNQRGVALGRMDDSDVLAVHARLRQLLQDHDARVDGIFYCPHDEGVCACRKPGTLLLQRARAFLGLATLRHSVMIGDSPRDIEAGRRVGARTVFVARPGVVTPRRVDVATSLLDAIRRELLARSTLDVGARALPGVTKDWRRNPVL
jgi:D-glycero-D-manno-heptose 1,7-bisphosphate phosphatase